MLNIFRTPWIILLRGKHMRVLFINNYPMDHAWELWEQQEYPAHHLWGTTSLGEYGIKVKILKYEQFNFLNNLGAKLKLGRYIDQQIRILLNYWKFDIVYSGSNDNTFLLSLLRSIGLFRKPIVIIIHHPLYKLSDKRARVFTRGHDKFLFLSSNVRNQVKSELHLPDEKMEVIKWGPDLDFYNKYFVPQVSESKVIISAGKSGRDHDTLVQAFSDLNTQLQLYCSKESAPKIKNIPSNIEIFADRRVSYKELVHHYSKAYAIAIPLEKTDSLAGLTSLLDALAVGKAVVMTKNKNIDIDIEKEKIGFWVEPNDTEGWKQAVTYLINNPDEVMEMGKRARKLAENKYNLKIFSMNLAKTLKTINQINTTQRI